jgi:hypothetical protein
MSEILRDYSPCSGERVLTLLPHISPPTCKGVFACTSSAHLQGKAGQGSEAPATLGRRAAGQADAAAGAHWLGVWSLQHRVPLVSTIVLCSCSCSMNVNYATHVRHTSCALPTAGYATTCMYSVIWGQPAPLTTSQSLQSGSWQPMTQTAPCLNGGTHLTTIGSPLDISHHVVGQHSVKHTTSMCCAGWPWLLDPPRSIRQPQQPCHGRGWQLQLASLRCSAGCCCHHDIR